ncbi:MAG: hypothetical protein ACMG6S_23230 [Byssovorax sp.]
MTSKKAPAEPTPPEDADAKKAFTTVQPEAQALAKGELLNPNGDLMIPAAGGIGRRRDLEIPSATRLGRRGDLKTLPVGDRGAALGF